MEHGGGGGVALEHAADVAVPDQVLKFLYMKNCSSVTDRGAYKVWKEWGEVHVRHGVFDQGTSEAYVTWIQTGTTFFHDCAFSGSHYFRRTDGEAVCFDCVLSSR
jgi:hypothetical protein